MRRVQPEGRAARAAKVKERRMAGEEHAVITVEGGGGQYRRRPCEDCPWRKDAVGKFPPEAFRLSANTGTRSEHLMVAKDNWHHTFGCHQTGPDKPVTCAGYIIKGYDAIGWRVAVSRRKFDPDKVRTNVPLFEGYYEMAVANGVPPDDPTLEVCRP